MNKKTLTTRPINLLTNKEDILWWQDKQLSLFRSLPKPRVSFHKQRLGKQHYCFTGEYRYWVWERSFKDSGKEIGWRVYVSDKKGICFEVTENCHKGDIRLAFADYLSALDVELVDERN